MKILRSIADRMLILRNPSKTLYLLNIFANSSVKWTVDVSSTSMGFSVDDKQYIKWLWIGLSETLEQVPVQDVSIDRR